MATRDVQSGWQISQHDVMLLHKAIQDHYTIFDYLILTRGGGSPVAVQVIWRDCPSVASAT